MLRLKEDHVYTCGDPMVAEDVEDPGMVGREAINCTTEVETSYFSTSLNHYLPPHIRWLQWNNFCLWTDWEW